MAGRGLVACLRGKASANDYSIDEALRGAPDLDLAQARLHAAMAQVQGAHAAHPRGHRYRRFYEQKQSYNNLIPKSALPQGWNDYGFASVNLSWELDFWGSIARRSLRRFPTACGPGRGGADPLVLSPRSPRPTRAWCICTPCVTTRRILWGSEPRPWRCSVNGTILVSRTWRVCVRWKPGRPQRRATCLRLTRASACKRTRLPRSSAPVPIAASPSPVPPPSLPDPRAYPRTWLWIFSDGVPTSLRPARAPRRRPGGSTKPRQASTPA